ncbi:MAG: hypothetical protein JW973_18550 [Bacteroidales bacterium]|nr:hypothetical protein [Bacteroidales bacterium]
MNTREIERLKFRRQYVLTPLTIECPFMHNKMNITSKYLLYAHVDLLLTEYCKDDLKLLLLGDLFDSEDPKKDNNQILKDLAEHDFEQFLDVFSNYCGRYVLIYSRQNRLIVLHDAMAARKVFYCDRNNDLWIASQPFVLANVLNLSKTNNPSKIKYYHSKEYHRLSNANVGDTTYFDEIKQLIPNHYLDVNDHKIIRYWPVKKMESLSLTDAARKCSKMIKGNIESIVSRYDVMIPFTAGKDSRTLFAASRDVKDKIYFYLNKHAGISDKKPDVYIPKKLLAEAGLDHHIVDTHIPVDEDFEKVYYENNPFASRFFLPVIYNYYINFSEKVNLPGNCAANGLSYYYSFRKRTAETEDLVNIIGLKRFGFAREYYAEWLAKCADICRDYNISIISLFYWEERLTNGLLQIQLDKDIAQEEFNPFNSRKLISYYLSVNPAYIVPPYYIFYKEIIRQLWPDVLKVPINPSLRNSLIRMLKTIGILDGIYKIKYKLTHACRKYSEKDG